MCGLVVPLGMNRLISWPTFAAHTTVLNIRNPVLCWLYNEVYCPFYSQFRRLTLKRLNLVVPYIPAIFILRELLSSLEKGHSQDSSPFLEKKPHFYRLFYRDYYIFVTRQGRSKWNSCHRLAVMGHKTVYRLSLWFIVLPRKLPPLQYFVFSFFFL